MKRNIPPSKCERCGQLLSRDWPYSLCDKCWRAKYHAPPGQNYFPEDGPAVKLAATFLKHNHPPISHSQQHVSSSALSA